jgi:hypothetical protein
MSPRALLAICALVLPIPVAAAGCGTDEAADMEPREVLERTFDNDTEVTSGVFGLSLAMEATGEEEASFTAEVNGPFQGDAGEPHALPQLDLSGSASGEGGGEEIDFEGRVVLTEESAFVEYEDETYEVGARDFARISEAVESQAREAGAEDEGPSFRESCEQAVEQAGGDPAACDIDLVEDWLTNLENEGIEDVEGTEAVHVSGDLNVERALTDLGDIVESIPGVSLQGIQPGQLANAVPEASFDVYSGTEDFQLHRFDINLAIDPAAATAGLAVVPVERVDLGFSLTLTEVNEPQTIDTPTGPTRPIEDLLGEDPFDFDTGLGALGAGAPNGAGDAGPEVEAGPEGQEYLECITEAGGDPEAIQACAELLE